MQPPSAPPIQYEIGESTLERQTRIRPSATPPVISDVVHARACRQLAGTLEGAAAEAPCAICRGVGLITAELHCALAGDQNAA
eukprot:2130791-Pyramimonas_sp.AAC.1